MSGLLHGAIRTAKGGLTMVGNRGNIGRGGLNITWRPPAWHVGLSMSGVLRVPVNSMKKLIGIVTAILLTGIMAACFRYGGERQYFPPRPRQPPQRAERQTSSPLPTASQRLRRSQADIRNPNGSSPMRSDPDPDGQRPCRPRPQRPRLRRPRPQRPRQTTPTAMPTPTPTAMPTPTPAATPTPTDYENRWYR